MLHNLIGSLEIRSPFTISNKLCQNSGSHFQQSNRFDSTLFDYLQLYFPRFDIALTIVRLLTHVAGPSLDGDFWTMKVSVTPHADSAIFMEKERSIKVSPTLELEFKLCVCIYEHTLGSFASSLNIESISLGQLKVIKYQDISHIYILINTLKLTLCH